MHSSIATRSTSRSFNLALTFLFALWVFFVSAHHKAWRDEADVWLAARDMSPGQLFHWLGGAGSPGLWYLLVMPLAKLRLPYDTMLFVHSAMAVVGAALLAFFAPFPRTLKALLVFSYFLGYEYAVVARSYVLTCLLLFLIAMVLTAPTRRYWLLGLLLFFLANANVHGFFFAGIIGTVAVAEMIRRREQSPSAWIGIGLALVGAALAIVQLVMTPSQVPSTFPRWPVIGYSIAEAFLPHVPHFSAYSLHVPHNHHVLIYLAYFGTRAAGAIVAISALYLMRRTPAAIVIVVAAWVSLQYIGVFKWYGNERHAGLFFLVIVFGLWLAKFSGQTVCNQRPFGAATHRASYAVLLASLCVSCAIAFIWSCRDIRRDYSGAKEAADFLQNPQFAKLPIAAAGGQQPESLLPYLPDKQLWYVGRQEFATYIAWDRDWASDETLPEDEVLARVHRQFADQPHLLLMPVHPMQDAESAGYRLVFRNAHQIFGHVDETYYIYASLDPDTLAAQRPGPSKMTHASTVKAATMAPINAAASAD